MDLSMNIGGNGAYNPARIVLARHMEGVTQRELSGKTGISQSRLSKIQNGFVVFGEHDAKRIATALAYPLSFFSSDWPSLPLTALTYRKTSKSSVSELSAVAAEYSMLAWTAVRLSELLRISGRKRAWIDAIAPKTDTVSSDTVEELAAESRARMGLKSTGAIGNLTRSLERCGVVVAPMSSTGGRLDGTGSRYASEGVTCPSCGDTLCIGYSAGSCISGDRQRFAKAHELGHLILHRRRRPAEARQAEHEAHLFAGALLLPADDARQMLQENSTLGDYLKVKSGWGISVSAVISRARTLGIIDVDRYRSLNIQLSSRGWRKREPVNVGVEHPLLLKQMLEAAFGVEATNGERVVKSFEAADSLGVPFRYLDYWAGGLVEEGADLGYCEPRITAAASDDETLMPPDPSKTAHH